MAEEKRKHKRFSATAFLNRPVNLMPLPPYFGNPIKGILIDLSAGGMAVVLPQLIPLDSVLNMTVTFPDGFKLSCQVKVRHAMPRTRNFLHGIEFLSVPADAAVRIDRMSTDYIDCEARIQSGAPDVCKLNCAFFSMCNKKEKKEAVTDIERSLQIVFEALDHSPLKSSLPA